MGDMYEGIARCTFHWMDDCYAVDAQTKTRKSGEEGQLHFTYLMIACYVFACHAAYDGGQAFGGEDYPYSRTDHQQYQS